MLTYIQLNIHFCDPVAHIKTTGVDKGTGCKSQRYRRCKRWRLCSL